MIFDVQPCLTGCINKNAVFIAECTKVETAIRAIDELSTPQYLS
jgi:hypothetical protein